MIRYFAGFIMIVLLGVLYEKYKLKYIGDEELNKENIIRQFLLNDSQSLGGKPILWIHSVHQRNSRLWPSFYSRTTTKLNQPYLLSCLESIIKNCSNSFNICLIDDSSFGALIPGWSIDVAQLPFPVRDHMRTLGLSKLLYYFGGMLLPDSTIVLSDLRPTYRDALVEKCCFTAEMVSKNSTATYLDFFPSHMVLGCKQNSPVMKEYMMYLEALISRDYTDQIAFLGEVDRWLYRACKEARMVLVDGTVLGTKDSTGVPVTIDRLMGNTFISFSPGVKGIYVPRNEILERTQFEWFARLSQNQLRTCNNIIAKYLLIAQSQSL